MLSLRSLFLTISITLSGVCSDIILAQVAGLEFTNFSQQIGKLHGQINKIVEDDLGYLWFGTASGLYRYDGYAVREYHHDVFDSTTIGSNGVIEMVVDKAGQIWTSSIAGVSRFDRATETFKRYLPYGNEGDAKRQNIVRDLFVDKDNDLWMAGHETLMKIEHGTDEFIEVYEDGAYGERRNIRAITQGSDGRIWCGTAQGVAALAPSDTAMTYHRLYLDRDPTKSLEVREMIFISDTELLLSSPFGFFIYNISTGEVVRDSILVEFGQFNVSQIMPGRSSDFWIASRFGGLLHVTKAGETLLYEHDDQDSRSLHTNEVVSSLVDQFGNLWVGTMTGVEKSRVNPGAVQMVVNSDKLYARENLVSRVEYTSDNILWMLTRGGLYAYDGTDRFGQQYDGGKGLPLYNSICETVDGDLWIPAGRRELCRKAKNGDQFVRIETNPPIGGELIFKILQAQEDPDILWIGTTRGLARFNRRTYSIEFHQPTQDVDVPSDHMIVFAQDRYQIWVYYSFAGQLGVFDKQKLEFDLIDMPADKKFMLEGIVNDAVVHDGSFWLATGHGITRFDQDDGSFKMYTGSSGLLAPDVVSVFVDANDTLWAVGQQYIGKFDPQSEEFECFDFSDRVRNFSSKGRTITPEGMVWLGTMSGAFGFHPDSMKTDREAPLVHLTSFEIDNSPLELSTAYEYIDDVTLESDQNDITFGFTGVQLVAPERVTYKCKLEGYDSEWTDLGNRRSKNYTNLDHGDYVFRVMAANQDGVWSTPGLVLPVTIKPPFTATIWFVGLMFLTGVLIILVAFRIWSRQQSLLRDKTIAERSAKYRAEFLAHTSHEVRTPLNAILGLSRLARETEDAGDKSRYVEAIETSSNNLLKIINDLLDHSKLESGTFHFKSEPFSLSRVADQMSDLFTTLASDKGLRFIVSREGPIDSGQVVGDELRLLQVLTNLVGNAIKFTESGTVELKFDLETSQGDKAIATMQVIDTGVGIDQEALNAVFERFYESGAHSGSGLGLYITRQLVEQQGGVIELKSAVGQGTRVKVRMPYDFIEGTVGAEASIAEVPEITTQLNILSVDDSPFNHMVITEMIKKYGSGSSVAQATSGAQALDMVSKSDYDLIILDARMPGMDGFETATELRRQGYTNPILGATASATADVIQECLDSGMNAVVTKPIDARTFMQKLLELCVPD